MVLLIGSYPPPLGGVSVFLKRYKRKLEAEGHTVRVLDPTKLNNPRLLLELLTTNRYDLISLHYPSLPIMKLFRRLGVAGKTEVWDHNWRLLEEWNARKRNSYGSFLERCQKLIIVTQDLREYYERHSVHIPIETVVQHAFLPPNEDDETEILASYPDDILQFINRSHPLLAANAFKITFQKDVDLYGLDMCVRLVSNLKTNYPDIGLIFALAEPGDADHFKSIKREIAIQDIERNFQFLTGQKELWPLLKKADLMVRPTSSDGYSLSVAEALHFGCRVVASDAVARPPQVLLFHSRDDDDFLQQCRQVLSNKTTLQAAEKP